MKSDAVTLTLGDFVFSESEIPERIPFGGEQAIVKHDLIGGGRILQAMGAFDTSLEWSGWLCGASAVERAKTLDAMRVKGAPMLLTWGDFRYWVVIESFRPDYEYAYRIPYRIVCLPAINYGAPDAESPDSSLDDSIDSCTAEAEDLTDEVGDSTLSGMMGSLKDAVSSVSSFATAAQAQISAVLQPVAQIQNQVGTLLASTGNTLQNIATVGGILPNNPIAKQVAGLNSQVSLLQQQSSLVQLRNVTGRIGAGASLGDSSQSVTMAGGNLFTLAAKTYGDAKAWAGIAQANGITDPTVTGLQTLKLPANPGNTGGVLGE